MTADLVKQPRDDLPALPQKVSFNAEGGRVASTSFVRQGDVELNFKRKLRDGSAIFSTLLMIAFNVLDKQFAERFVSPPLILTCLILFGIPHGAIDHLLYYQVYYELRPFCLAKTAKSFSPKQTYFETFGGEGDPRSIAYTLRTRLFYFNYFSIMLMWAAAWINLPILTFWAFLTVSAYHFGEGDLNHMSSTMLVSPAAMYLSRGLMLIGSIATSQPTKTLPIIASMTRMQDASALLPNSDWIYRASIAQHIILTTLHVLLSEAQYATWATELWKCILFTGLFFALDPLTAFAVYFGIWHSLGSIADEIIFLKSRNAAWNRTSSSSNADIQMLDVLRFYRNAAPFTLLSVLGMLGFLLLVTGGHVSVDVGATTLWSVFVVSISILTGPHMWVMKNVNARVLGREGRIKKEGLTVNGEHLEEKDGLDPLGLEHLAVDWIVGGGWWWMPQNRKQP